MRLIFSSIVFFITSFCFAQKSIPEVIKRFNKNSVKYIKVEELKTQLDSVTLLDAREISEYNVSHIKNAQFIGYKKFDEKEVEELIPNKDEKIVVYCSLGVRSENIGEKLIKLGYTNVQNLYGGIFEWKNKENQVVDNENKITEKVHAFSKHWGSYLNKGIKIYD